MWGTALQLAEAWHTPPWEIVDAPGSRLWAARWVVYREELKAAQERKNKGS